MWQRCSILLFLVWLYSVGVAASPSLDRRALDRFIQEMVTEHGFDRTQLGALFEKARMSSQILEAISRPAEAKPWYKYRPIFVTRKRTQAGIKFWAEHFQILERAERVYGVAPEIIVSIIGVETLYGKRMGNHRVIDALATLAFNYPTRASFFRSELKDFLLLTREQETNPLTLTGSYAGAMGMPQFIASSYRNYAVDFDDDGRADIWQDPADAIGSVANYLKVHGWRAGGPIAIRAQVTGDGYLNLLGRGLQPHTAWDKIKQAGVIPEREVTGNPLAVLIALETGSGRQYWLALQNFYVITRYNRSPLYAMAVFQLAEAIHAGYEER